MYGYNNHTTLPWGIVYTSSYIIYNEKGWEVMLQTKSKPQIERGDDRDVSR